VIRQLDFSALERLRDQGDAPVFSRARQVAELAARARLPVIYELRNYVEAGGLISHRADVDALWHRAATFVDKILKGAKSADLPVERPKQFELLQRADRGIE